MGTFTTNIKLGTVGYVVHCNYGNYEFFVKEMRVGKVQIEQMHPEAVRFRDDKVYKETYMCFDTGVGSGSLYTYGEDIFSTREDAENIGIVKHKQRACKQIAEMNARKKELAEYNRRIELMQLKELKAKYET